MLVGDLIQKFRLQRGLLVKEASKAARIHESTLLRYEVNKLVPSICNLKRIKHYWNLTDSEWELLLKAVNNRGSNYVSKK